MKSKQFNLTCGRHIWSKWSRQIWNYVWIRKIAHMSEETVWKCVGGNVMLLSEPVMEQFQLLWLASLRSCTGGDCKVRAAMCSYAVAFDVDWTQNYKSAITGLIARQQFFSFNDATHLKPSCSCIPCVNRTIRLLFSWFLICCFNMTEVLLLSSYFSNRCDFGVFPVNRDTSEVLQHNKKRKNLLSFLTCQEPLWSFSSGRQTGRQSSRSRWRRYRSLRASWGKNQSRFLRGTSHCPWKPLRKKQWRGRNKREINNVVFVASFSCDQTQSLRRWKEASLQKESWVKIWWQSVTKSLGLFSDWPARHSINNHIRRGDIHNNSSADRSINRAERISEDLLLFNRDVKDVLFLLTANYEPM